MTASYTFRRRTNNLPDGVLGKCTFEARSYFEALQLASDYWFSGQKVSDYLVDGNDVVTLLSSNSNGNVIGTLMNY